MFWIPVRFPSSCSCARNRATGCLAVWPKVCKVCPEVEFHDCLLFFPWCPSLDQIMGKKKEILHYVVKKTKQDQVFLRSLVCVFSESETWVVNKTTKTIVRKVWESDSSWRTECNSQKELNFFFFFNFWLHDLATLIMFFQCKVPCRIKI